MPKIIKCIFLFSLVIFFHISSAIAQKTKSGTITSKNNTIVPCQIIIGPDKKFDEYRFVKIYSSVEGIKTLYPHQIMGYQVEKELFQSINMNDTVTHTDGNIFAKVVSKGKAILLYTPLINEIRNDFYFFKKENEKYFNIYRNQEIMTLGDSPYKIYALNEERVFLSFFAQYFKDCNKVTRGLKSGFYTIEDIKHIFDDYNECK